MLPPRGQTDDPPAMTPSAETPSLKNLLVDFSGALRRVGLPVSLTERIDALEAVRCVDLADRDALKSALGAVLVKNRSHYPAFETLFDVYFSLRGVEYESADGAWPDEFDPAYILDPDDPPESQGESLSEEELLRMLMAVLADGSGGGLAAVARRAVQRYAGMEPGRPVGGTYYLYRTLRHLHLEELVDRLAEELGEASPLERRLRRVELQDRVDRLSAEVEAEIRRRLVADRGHETMSSMLSRPLPEDVEFMHASSGELEQIRRAVTPLTRKLAAKLARKRKSLSLGALDYRRTFRDSLSSGGVPVEPKFRRARPSKPEMVIIADVSGSVAAFARFTLHLMYAVNSHFSKVRSFVFIDGLDEVSHLFERSDEVSEAIRRINTEADVVWLDGHSDYGHALGVFWEKYEEAVGPRTSVLVLGDARSNYHASGAWVLGKLKGKARRVFWLNPEPRSYWDTGDSVMREYLPHCDGVHEVRTLRQLERFVERTF